MTQQALTHVGESRPAEAAPRPGVAAQALAKAAATLDRIESRLALVDCRPLAGEDYSALAFAVQGVYPGAVAEHGPWVKVNSATRSLLTRLPTAQSETERAEALRADIEAGPDRRASLALVSQLLDAFPNGRPANLPVYAASITHDLCAIGLSPVLVARTCQRVRRTARFLPTVAEMIDAGEAVRKEYRDALERADVCGRRIEALRQAIEAEDAAQGERGQ